MTDDKSRGWGDGFACGVAWSVARLIDMFDQPTMALDILRESGVDVMLADRYDRNIIERCQRKE
ncbi:MAG: hypothetical protein ABFD60_07930 [Bryobacteraceae bacterium]